MPCVVASSRKRIQIPALEWDEYLSLPAVYHFEFRTTSCFLLVSLGHHLSSMEGTVITQTTLGGDSATNTIWLPAQTTPFTPVDHPSPGVTKKWCEPSPDCQSYDKLCSAQYFTNYEVSSTTTMVRTRTECFPKGYYNIGESVRDYSSPENARERHTERAVGRGRTRRTLPHC